MIVESIAHDPAAGARSRLELFRAVLATVGARILPLDSHGDLVIECPPGFEREVRSLAESLGIVTAEQPRNRPQFRPVVK